MLEINYEIDLNFVGCLNILCVGVFGVNDGIIFIVGVVIGVVSVMSNIWIIFLLGFAVILVGVFLMVGGEYVFVLI